MNNKKKTKGRRKIEIKKIEDPISRLVTFSKRRKGLFAKASELAIVTGAEFAIFVESPGGRIYAHGHPDVQTVMDRYLGSENELGSETAMQAGLKGAAEFLEVSKKLDVEKSKMKEEDNDQPFWWDMDIPTNIKDLEEYIASLEGLIKNLDARANEPQP